MNLLPALTAWQFAAAGLACAAGPILIHLLNRRRYKVVEWAAMDFLREALQRNRRIMQLRDIVLLLLRTAAVLLFGLALAQPYFSANETKFDGKTRLHAVMVVDNSLSMAYQSLGGTAIDRAKQRAKEFVEKLPRGSLISVVPLCGSRFGYSPDPYQTKDEALEALAAIEVVDRSASIQRAINEAKKACEAAPELSKRVVFLSDQQRRNWTDLTGETPFEGIESLQVVDVSESEIENTWISDFRMQDGLADVETPTTFIVELQHRGAAERKDVQVTLSVDGTDVASKSITLDAAEGAREVTFEHVFSAYRPEPGLPENVPVRVSISADRLTVDDERYLVANVVASLPVVFVDQVADADEDSVKNKLGETRHIRTLLAPRSSANQTAGQLISIRHATLDDLEEQREDLLADARLVVIAGIESAGTAAPLLREYVQQGGQLVIAAGGAFDVDAWNRTGWLDGGGILPMRLVGELGGLPDQVGEDSSPFFLSFESLGSHDYFQLAGVAEEELRDLYAEPFFFKAVRVDDSPESRSELLEAEIKRLEEELTVVAEVDALQKKHLATNGNGTDASLDATLNELESRLRSFRPNWLLWRESSEPEVAALPADEAERRKLLEPLAAQSLPRVRARFTSETGPVYMVERQVGEGQVMFVSSGLLSSWNTLARTNTIVMFDRILRGKIRSTLPPRNFTAQDRIPLPLPNIAGEVEVRLTRPGLEDQPEYLDTGFLGKEQRGVEIIAPYTRGVYRVAARPVRYDESDGDEPVWNMVVSVNGTSDESDLTPMSRVAFDERVGAANVRWVEAGESISLAGSAVQGQNSWRYLILAVLVILLLEGLILAWPALRRGTTSETPELRVETQQA